MKNSDNIETTGDDTTLANISTPADLAGCLEQGEFKFWVTSATGIAIRDEIPETELRTLTQNVALMFEATGKKHGQAAMMMGDILTFWEAKFPDKDESQEIENSREYMRVSMKTLTNWAWIAKKIEPSRRRENLSLAHHEAIAKYPAEEQDEFLRLADNEGLSVSELKEKIRERHPGKPRAAKPKVTVAIDTDNESAVTDALQIIANHLSNPETKWPEAWREHTHAIHKAHKKVFLNNGKAKA